MNKLSSLLYRNEILDAEIEAFCVSDPEYMQMKKEFYQAAQKIARQVGFDVYDRFETCLYAYLYRTADLYYLFGLDLRQELLQTFL